MARGGTATAEVCEPPVRKCWNARREVSRYSWCIRVLISWKRECSSASRFMCISSKDWSGTPFEGILTAGGCAGRRKTRCGGSNDSGKMRSRSFAVSTWMPAAVNCAATCMACVSESAPGRSSEMARCSRSPRIFRIHAVQLPRGPCSRKIRTPSCQACSMARGKSNVPRACAVSASAMAERLSG